MPQVLIDTPATLSETWYEDGVAVNPGTVTVTITRADGTAIVTAAATTPAAAFVGDTNLLARSYDLAVGDTAQLDMLRAAWSSSTHGTLVSQIEIVGGFYFSIAEFRAKYADAAVDDLSVQQIADARSVAEEIIEHESHVAFVPRAKRLTLSGEGRTRASIPLYMARAIQSVTVDGAAQTVDSSYRVGTGAIYRIATWPQDISNVVAIVEHGFDEPPRRLKEAAMVLTYHRAVKGPIDDRATSIPAGEAGGTITLLTPGVGNAITGLPEVDAAIIAHRLPPLGSVASVPMSDSANTYPSNVDSFAIG